MVCDNCFKYYIICLLCLLCSCTSSEVEIYGNVSGVIYDHSTGMPIQGAVIKLDDGKAYKTSSDKDGKYLLKMVEMGNRKIIAEKSGYIDYCCNLIIPSGASITCDISLTPISVPEINTLPVTDISDSEACLHGFVKSDGGADITKYGFYIGENRNNASKVLVPIDGDEFSYTLKELKDGQTYGCSAFASNGQKEGEGEWVCFTTDELTLSVVETQIASNITHNSAVLNGKIVNQGNSLLEEIGFYVKKEGEDAYVKYKTDIETLQFSFQLTSLQEGTLYYYKAYAINKKGEVIGEDLSFTTASLYPPQVKSLPARQIEYISATLVGEVYNNGGFPITDCGFYYGVEENNLIKYYLGSSVNGEFSVKITGLEDGCKYIFQAFACNNKGETCGEFLNFTTQEIESPTLYTGQSENITSSSARIHSRITYIGSGEITEYGFYYGENKNQLVKVKIGDNVRENQDYFVDITDLKKDTEYYYAGYAKNAYIEGVGELELFTTLAPPTVTTNSQYTLGLTSITCSGTVDVGKGAAVTACGFCWSITDENPTINDYIVYSNENTRNFSCTIKDCKDSEIYYVRAFAKNNDGLSYGKTIAIKSAACPSIELVVDDSYCNSSAKQNNGKLQYTYSVNPAFKVANPSNLEIEVGYYYYYDGSFDIIQGFICFLHGFINTIFHI